MIQIAAVLLALAQVKYPTRPAQGEFILDEAKILKDEDASEIRKVCGEVLAAKRAPIVVVTIKSMADYGASGWPVQRYAMNLFSEWAVGWSEWNYGMLLLVSTGDKKARIELGASWGHVKDPDAQKVMNEEIVPRFKRGDFSAGVLAGVKGLRGIAVSEIKAEPVQQVYGPAPSHPQTKPATPVYTPKPVPYQQVHRSHGLPSSSSSGTNWGAVLVVVGVVILGIIVVVALLKSGASSWGANPGVGADPGCSAFAGGCLGSSMGGWFGGSGYGYHRYGYWDDPWYRPWGWGGGWFGGGGHVDHYHHYDSGSSSGSDSGSSSSGSSDSGGGSWGGGGGSSDSGGGFSGGGGASGEW